MGELVIQINPEMFAEFIDEALEMLDNIDSDLIELENNPSDIEIIQRIFRPIHTIKGNSTFFDLLKVKKLAHCLENQFDLMRSQKMIADGKIISLLLNGIDELKAILLRVQGDGDEILDKDAFELLIEEIESASQASDQDKLWENAFANFNNILKAIPETLPEIKGKLRETLAIMQKLHPAGDATGIFSGEAPKEMVEIFAILAESDKRTLDDIEISSIAELLESLIKKGKDDETKSFIKNTIDDFNLFMENIGFDELLARTLRENLEKLQNSNSFINDDLTENAQSPKNNIHEGKQSTSMRKTMRVLEGDIDTFLSYVGELIVVGDMFNNLQKQVFQRYSEFEIIKEFRRVTGIFEQLSSNLQKSIMAIRKVPIKPLLMKVPRLVRDIAEKENKKINVTISGDDIKIDKSLIDVINGPLTHMVRNAADHGIESAEIRKAAGKNEMGKIDISVLMDESKFVLNVFDDGGGLDKAAIKSKAVKLGIINPNDELSESQIVDLIFSSGVSTAEKVTDISGRGVGMDVVKKSIEKIGGRIEVDSKRGLGSTFSLILPVKVTTQIINGFLVEVGGQPYVLPTNNIMQTAEIKPSDIMTTIGGNPFIKIHEEILPLKNLDTLLWNKSIGESDNLIAVIIKNSTGRFALIVDNVLGVHDMVQKRIEGMDNHLEYVIGGALMGDGSIALILDIEQIRVEKAAG